MTEIDRPTNREEAKAHLALWIEEERNGYATQKWEVDNDALQEQNVRSGEWINFPFSYLQRCRMGLDQPAARQALGKCITSSMSLLERAIEIYGPMPKPAVSTTEGALPWEVQEPEPDEQGSTDDGVPTFTDEQVHGMVANAIGFAIFAKEGDAVVTISDEESERVKEAATEVLCLLHKIETGEVFDQRLPTDYVYLDEIEESERDNYTPVSTQTATGRVLAIPKDAQTSVTPKAAQEKKWAERGPHDPPPLPGHPGKHGETRTGLQPPG